ncbi:hypothetical protein M3Y96_01038700 [Aphelenchoides besseyi]|nr:hypothetical protein M3Y96_01038700 [Aphelenchoides besseyi]
MSIFRFKARNQQKGTQKQQQQSPNATDKTKSDDAKQKFGAPTFLQYQIEEMFKADEKRLFYSRLISNGLLVLAVIMTIGSVLYMISELAMWSWSRKEAEEVLSKCGTPWKRTDCIRCIKTNDQQPVNVPMSRSAICHGQDEQSSINCQWKLSEDHFNCAHSTTSNKLLCFIDSALTSINE